MGVPEMKKADYKIPRGKLVSAEITEDGARLVNVKIMGDFFMHPEEAIVALEGDLKGIRVAELEEVVSRFFSKNKVSLFGISPRDFIHVIRLALEQDIQG